MPSAKVLIVDDEQNIRTLIQCCLEDAGYESIQVPNGMEALIAVQELAPDLMILDLAMPMLDGMSVLVELGHLWSSLPTRVIVVTAHGSVKTAIHALRLGASDFIEKPFSPDEIRQSVQAVLNETPAGAEAEEGYSQTLLAVRDALRSKRFAEAERKLMKAGTITPEEPWFLNLAGVLHESLGRIESARKFYARAIGKDRHYWPAKLNLERLGEIRRSGKSKIPVQFGDADADSDVEGPSRGELTSDASPLIGPDVGMQFHPEQARRDQTDEERRTSVDGALRRLSSWRPRSAARHTPARQ